VDCLGGDGSSFLVCRELGLVNVVSGGPDAIFVDFDQLKVHGPEVPGLGQIAHKVGN
jgi:hypothetical protein